MAENKKTKIILDCDPGIDDSVALIIACKNPKIDLLGITTVRGNQTIQKTTQNAINVTEWLGVDVPVYEGCEGPIVRDKMPSEDAVHGESGIAGAKFPKYDKKPQKKHAVNYIIDTLMESDGDITVVTIGPMTNLAMAMRMQPKIVDKINEIVLMGGSVGKGNVTAAAEFNMIADAEAAHICFKSGVPIVMVGLDATEKAKCYQEDVDRIKKYNNQASKLFCDIVGHYIDFQMRNFDMDGGPLHDPLALAYLVNHDVVKLKPAFSTVEVKGADSYGRTNCDTYLVYTDETPNSMVAMDTNRELFFEVLEESIKLYSD